MVLDHAERAAARTVAAWEELGTAGSLLAGDHDLGRASRRLRADVAAQVRAWQQGLTDLVKSDEVDRRTSRYLAYGARGLAATLAVAVVVDSAPGGTGVEAGRTLLDAVFGADAAARLISRGRADLERRIESLLADEERRHLAPLDALGLDPEAGRHLRDAARGVDDRRFEQHRSGEEDQP
jgi:hypothetical protein